MLRGWLRWLSPLSDGVYGFILTMDPADGIGASQTVVGSVMVANAQAKPARPLVRRG